MSMRVNPSEAIFEASDELRDLEGIPDRIPDRAARAILRMVGKLRTGSALTDKETDYLTTALKTAAEDPASTQAALGLLPVGRPPKEQGKIDDIANLIAEYHFQQGKSLTSSREASGAFELAAARLSISESAARNAWYAASLRCRIHPSRKVD